MKGSVIPQRVLRFLHNITNKFHNKVDEEKRKDQGGQLERQPDDGPSRLYPYFATI